MKPKGVESLDSFGTFIQSVSRGRTSEPAARPGGSGPRVVLRELVAHGPEPVGSLMAAVRLDIVAFAEALRSMRDAGLIRTSGSGPDELVELTPLGQQLAAIELEPEAK